MTETSSASPTLRVLSRRVAIPDTSEGLALVPAAVDVAGASIVAVHRLDAGPAPAAPPGVPSEDLGDRLVTPAFIDGHTHIALASLRGLSVSEDADHNLVEDFFFRLEAAMTADDVRAFARMGAYEAALCGTAMVWDHYYYPYAIVDALRDVGLTGVIAPTLQDLDGPGTAQLDDCLAATLAIAADDALRAVGIASAFGPHATDTVSPALFRRVADLAEGSGLPVHVHVAQSIDELERVVAREGCSPHTLLLRSGLLEAAPRSLLVHNIFATAEEVRALPRDRVVMGFCPHSKQIFAYLPEIRTWHGAGLPWLVATDCAASNDAANVQRDLRAAAGLRTVAVTRSAAHQRFVSTGDVEDARAAWAVRAAERHSTRWLADPTYLLRRVWDIPGGMHPRLRAGVIAPGHLANLAIWDTDHPSFWPGRDPLRALVMSDTSGALYNLMAAGRWLGEHGRYAQSLIDTDRYRAARAEASARLREVEARA